MSNHLYDEEELRQAFHEAIEHRLAVQRNGGRSSCAIAIELADAALDVVKHRIIAGEVDSKITIFGHTPLEIGQILSKAERSNETLREISMLILKHELADSENGNK